MRLGRAAVVTDTGRRRLGNEDAYVWSPPLFAIADGMGGARAGEIAAGIAADTLGGAEAETLDASRITALIVDANQRIWERSLADPSTAGMGTTVTVALLDQEAGTVVFGHVGDSRAYRIRDGALEQITTDHSLVAELVESGVLTPEEAERHPQRSAITRALGTEPAVEPDVFTVNVQPGDLFLLCSDGLSDMLTEDEIAAAIMRAGGDPKPAGDELVKDANARGGDDNITVLLFEVVAGEPEPFETAEPAPEEGDDATTDGAGPDETTDEAAAETAERARRHGAGPGGRIAAILLIAVVTILAVLILYWGITR
jgi:serine/threonine protein phosphatase PrpC